MYMLCLVFVYMYLSVIIVSLSYFTNSNYFYYNEYVYHNNQCFCVYFKCNEIEGEKNKLYIINRKCKKKIDSKIKNIFHCNYVFNVITLASFIKKKKCKNKWLSTSGFLFLNCISFQCHWTNTWKVFLKYKNEVICQQFFWKIKPLSYKWDYLSLLIHYDVP